jgi:hypothetical protein
MKLSVSVMAHPKRSHLVAGLIEALGIGDDRMVLDRKNDRWDTGRRAWEAHDPDADWHVVIQDDAIACADLVAGLARALDHVPAECIVSPYVGTRRPAKRKVERAVDAARAADASWIVMQALNWGVGIAAPVWTIPEMVAWCETETAYPNYDKRVGRYYLRVLGWHTWCTWPSLLDHRDDEPSLCSDGPGQPPHGPGRVAHEHWTGSALDLDWSKGSVVLEPMGGPRRPEPPLTSKIRAWYDARGRRRLVRIGSSRDAQLAADPAWSESPIKEAAHA